MDGAFAQALSLSFIALPTMFIVTIIFIAATKALVAAFPYKEEDDDEQS